MRFDTLVLILFTIQIAHGFIFPWSNRNEATTAPPMHPPKIISLTDRKIQTDSMIGDILEVQEGENISIVCSEPNLRRPVQYVDPVLTNYKNYNPLNYSRRTRRGTSHFNMTLHIENSQTTDTGEYRCELVGESYQAYYHSVYVFVRAAHAENIFIPLKNRNIYYQPEADTLIVPCKATINLKDTQVELWDVNGLWHAELPSYLSYDSRIGYLIKKINGQLPEQQMSLYCVYKNGGASLSSPVWESYPNPYFNKTYEIVWGWVTSFAHVGMNLNLTCTVQIPHIDEETTIYCPRCRKVVFDRKFDTQMLTAVIEDATMEDAGEYACQLLIKGDLHNEAKVNLEVSQTKGQIRVLEQSPTETTIKAGQSLNLFVKYQYYPHETCNTTWHKKSLKVSYDRHSNDRRVEPDVKNVDELSSQSVMGFDMMNELLTKDKAEVTDSGTYTLEFLDFYGFYKKLEFKVKVESDTIILNMSLPMTSNYTVLNETYYSAGSKVPVICRAQAFPLVESIRFTYRIPPSVDWQDAPSDAVETHPGTYEFIAFYDALVNQEREVNCKAVRGKANNSTSMKIKIANGKPMAKITNIIRSSNHLVDETDKNVYEGDSVELSCFHPENDKWTVFWTHNEETLPANDSNITSDGVTRTVKILLSNLTAIESKVYTCMLSSKQQLSSMVLNVLLNVLKTQKPALTSFDEDQSKVELTYGTQAWLRCPLDGIPKPRYQWLKDGRPYNTGVSTTANGTLYISRVNIEDGGIFTCKAENSVGSAEVNFTATVIGGPFNLNKLFIIGGICVFVVLAFFITWLTYTVHKQRKTNQDQVKSLGKLYEQLMRQIPTNGLSNPNGSPLPLDQRLAEIAYDRQYELERENLSVGCPIGAGKFGKVCQGTLTKYNGHCNELQTVPVAIKQPLLGNNFEHQSMLVQELKLMAALGNHPNVIALLGAVTKLMKLGELHVVLEYCSNGNLKDYILARKENFINELSHQEMNKDGTIKKSQYASEAYVNYSPPEGTLPSETEYLLADSCALSTSDLLSFAMQIAKGMNYLANIPCVHRDLAARNILVTSNKILRIADYGLARNMQKEYYRQQKKGKMIPLPVRWMSIEAIEHGMYTVASDIWSYGIILYELFSLSGIPYPSFGNEDLLEKLKSGYRNPKPKYAHQEIFQLMTQCCEEEVRQRPNFTRCVEVTRNHLMRCNPHLLQQVEAETQKEATKQQELTEWARQEEGPMTRANSTVQIPQEVPQPPKKSFLNKMLGRDFSNKQNGRYRHTSVS